MLRRPFGEEQPLELFGSQYPGGKIFNNAAFTAPPRGQQGNFGRNVLRAFGATQADVALQRQFAFETLNTQVFVEEPDTSTGLKLLTKQ